MLFSIVFLLFMVGIPIVMVVFIIVLVKKKNRAVKEISTLVQTEGWEFTKSDGGHPLYGILENGVFAIQNKGHHTLSNIVKTDGGMWICDYHYVSSGTSKHRRSHNSILAVLERRSVGPDFWILRRHEGALGKVAEAALMGRLRPVPGNKWSWVLASSVDAFQEAGWVDPVPNVLEKRMVPGSSLFLTGRYLVLGKPGVLDGDRLLQLKEDAEMIRDLI